jgi:hypothetical protein
MESAQKPPVTRAEKLRWYAGQLMTDAATQEKEGRPEGAIPNYLKAAEIYLLLAKVEQNYTAWRYYTDNADQCQKKVKHLIATAPASDPEQPGTL